MRINVTCLIGLGSISAELGRQMSETDKSRATRAEILRLRGQRPFGPWNGDSWISEKRKYFCLATPKAGCTTVKTALHMLDGGSPPTRPMDIHGFGERLRDFSDDQIVDILASESWYRFSFVRNPYGRLLSTYKSKIASWKTSDSYRLRKGLQDKLEPASTALFDGTVPSFREFVRLVAACRDDETVWYESHIVPQIDLLLLRITTYNFIGRLENLTNDLTHVLRQLGASNEILRAASNRLNETYSSRLSDVYDDSTANIVFEMYGRDFQEFEYDRSSWKS